MITTLFGGRNGLFTPAAALGSEPCCGWAVSGSQSVMSGMLWFLCGPDVQELESKTGRYILDQTFPCCGLTGYHGR